MPSLIPDCLLPLQATPHTPITCKVQQVGHFLESVTLYLLTEAWQTGNPSGQSWSLSSDTHLGTFPWTGRGSGFCLKSYSALRDPGRICVQPHISPNWGDMRLRQARLSPSEPRPDGHMGCQHCQRCITFFTFLVFQNVRNRGLE